MAVVVCGVGLLLAIGAAAAVRERLGLAHSYREAILVAATLLSGFVVAITEGLGSISELRFTPVFISWLTVDVGLAALLWSQRDSLAGWPPRGKLNWPDRALLAIVSSIVLAAGLVAVLCPPNNWDVTLYHLPRQLQWIQQGSVDHFPTQDYRLTVNPPFAEFVGLHAMILSGTDRLATVESWAAMLLTLLAISLVARELGLPRRGQLLAALFAVTIPVGFHEAENGKNDWVVALWLTAATFWTLRVWKLERVLLSDGILAGLAVGLLLLTKGTGAVYAVPIVALGGIGLIARRRPGWMPAAIAVAVVGLAANSGHWSRNLAAYGSVGGKTFGLDNDRHGPVVWASGLLRNVTMHLAGPKMSWNHKVEKNVHRIHEWLGIGADDGATTWAGLPFKVEYRPSQEDFATAPIHTLLLIVALPAATAYGLLRDRLWLVYAIVVGGGFLLFCGTFKWQQWHPRLHLPCFALGGVAVGWLLIHPGIRWAGPIAVAGLIASVVPAATRSEVRSLGSSSQNVFRTEPDRLRFFGHEREQLDCREVVNRVRGIGADVVDLVNQGPLPWEYPLALWLRHAENPPRVGYFYPVSGSPTDRPPASVVIDVGSSNPPALIRHPRTRIVYRLFDRVGIFTIYRPASIGSVENGYTLTATGWMPIAERIVSGPPACDQPVARFGIGTEPAAER